MKRNMELVRKILMELADSECPLDATVFVDDAHDFQFVAYHFDIMSQAGLVDASVHKEWGGSYTVAEVSSLTWEGQDFLASVKSPKVWSRVKSMVAKHAGDAAFETIKTLAVKAMGELLMS